MTEKSLLAQQHNSKNELVFLIKSSGLILLRMLRNLCAPKTHCTFSQQLVNAPVIARSQSALWSGADTPDNWILTAGKVENLRIAARCLNGLEVPAGQVFSFWQQVGYPNFGRGFVLGRELREGCIVPSIAGGLCQLSNALYDAALRANFEIIERHRHSQIIPGSLAEQDRDATVKWNYIDLRFKASRAFRIEVTLDADNLCVQFKAQQAAQNSATPLSKHSPTPLNDCYSCGNRACFKHPTDLSSKQHAAQTCYLVDERWPEFEQYLQTVASKQERMIVPIKLKRYRWRTPAQTMSTGWAGWYRTVSMRFAGKRNVFELGLKLDQSIAQQAGKHIPVQAHHVLVAQNLLPALYASGALGGRSFDVLMTRLPIGVLQDKLDLAYQQHHLSPTLNDFRATPAQIALENQALQHARRIITPHAAIAQLFPHKTIKLAWHVPKAEPVSRGQKVLFPASALARKGAYEVKRLAQELSLSLLVSGKASEYDNFWENVQTEPFNGQYHNIGLVIYPAFIEHQPRALLQALARGIPVICSSACGLDQAGVIQITAGDYQALREAVLTVHGLTSGRI